MYQVNKKEIPTLLSSLPITGKLPYDNLEKQGLSIIRPVDIENKHIEYAHTLIAAYYTLQTAIVSSDDITAILREKSSKYTCEMGELCGAIKNNCVLTSSPNSKYKDLVSLDRKDTISVKTTSSMVGSVKIHVKTENANFVKVLLIYFFDYHDLNDMGISNFQLATLLADIEAAYIKNEPVERIPNYNKVLHAIMGMFVPLYDGSASFFFKEFYRRSPKSLDNKAHHITVNTNSIRSIYTIYENSKQDNIDIVSDNTVFKSYTTDTISHYLVSVYLKYDQLLPVYLLIIILNSKLLTIEDILTDFAIRFYEMFPFYPGLKRAMYKKFGHDGMKYFNNLRKGKHIPEGTPIPKGLLSLLNRIKYIHRVLPGIFKPCKLGSIKGIKYIGPPIMSQYEFEVLHSNYCSARRIMDAKNNTKKARGVCSC